MSVRIYWVCGHAESGVAKTLKPPLLFLSQFNSFRVHFSYGESGMYSVLKNLRRVLFRIEELGLGIA